ncbi:MAG: histidine--tRNA ligase [Methanomassiliicoccales archaeon]|nr:histidine--tRNA ligase [Methanomassiliicoccales archaeon]
MIQRPRGTRDFGPDEMETRRYLEGLMRLQGGTFGFREISTPIFEHAELFTVKSGPSILEEMYAFRDKGGRDITLRPELTAPFIRFFVNELTDAPRPLKIFYVGPCFRYERPQSGRFREFYQFGAELIGAQNPESDAEVIALAASIMEKAGLKDYRIRVGHIGILRKKLKDAEVSPEMVPSILQKLDKKLYDEARPMMERSGMSDASIDEVVEITKVAGSVSVLEDFEGESKDYLQDVARILDVGNVKNLQIDLGVIRGLDYYTGMVFEIDVPKLGAEKQVCGGGSYSLSELFGGEKVFSTGFAIGFDRTLMALEKDGFKAPRKGIEAYVIPVSERMREKAFEIVSSLRAKGIAADVDLMRRNLAKNLKYANSIKARKAVIVGEIELEARSAIVRDMETGYQEAVRIDDLAEFLLKNGRNGV